MTPTERDLLAVLRDRCYQEGDFTLASGAKSKFYFDSKNAFLSSAAIGLIGEAIYEKTKDLDIDAIGGLEVGAIPLTTATVSVYAANNRPMNGFFVRNEAKKHGTKKIIEGGLASGSRVVIVDDVATSGGSIMKAVNAVRQIECEIEAVVVLVDREEGAEALFKKENIPFLPVFRIRQFKKPLVTSS